MKKSDKGFTLIELLVVISIIAILVGLLFPALSLVKNQGEKAAAFADIANVTLALNAYVADYAVYPPEDLQVDAGEDNSGIISVLRAREGADTRLNPMKKNYLDLQRANELGDGRYRKGLTPDGQLVDPWTHTFGIRWDADFDGVVALPPEAVGEGEPTVDLDIIVWSAGKDGETGTNDDVKNWQ